MITKKPYTDLIKNPTKPTKTKLLEKDKVKLSKKPIKTILPKKPIKVLDNKKKTSVNKSEIKSSTKSANTKTRGKPDTKVVPKTKRVNPDNKLVEKSKANLKEKNKVKPVKESKGKLVKESKGKTNDKTKVEPVGKSKEVVTSKTKKIKDKAPESDIQIINKQPSEEIYIESEEKLKSLVEYMVVLRSYLNSSECRIIVDNAFIEKIKDMRENLPFPNEFSKMTESDFLNKMPDSDVNTYVLWLHNISWGMNHAQYIVYEKDIGPNEIFDVIITTLIAIYDKNEKYMEQLTQVSTSLNRYAFQLVEDYKKLNII